MCGAHIRGGRTNELVGECMGVDGLMLAGESEWVDGRMHGRGADE